MTKLSSLARPLQAASLAIATLASPASAVTVNEGSFTGGDFSNRVANPTAIASGIRTVTGALRRGDRDVLAFTGMATGAQTVTLNLWATGAGPLWQGSLRYSTTPFRNSASGVLAGAIAMSNAPTGVVTMTQTLSFNLGATFGGTLFLMMNLRLGTGASYSLNIPGNVPAAVPLPAAALLLGSAVIGIGASGRRRPRSAAPQG